MRFALLSLLAAIALGATALPSAAPDPAEPAAEEPADLPSEFPITLPREFGPGPVIRGRVASDTGEPIEGLAVRTTTWRPSARGCFLPTYRLGWSEVDEDGSFRFHVDSDMLGAMPERKGRTPFSIEAPGYMDREVVLDPELWSALRPDRERDRRAGATSRPHRRRAREATIELVLPR